MFFGLFGKKNSEPEEEFEDLTPIRVDMHSHLLPGLDDGASTIEDTVEMVRGFQEAGFRKLIATPHVIHGTYDNTPEKVRAALELTNNRLKQENIPVVMEAGAEYFFDDYFVQMVEEGQELLTFGGGRYLLFETGFQSEPLQMKDIILTLQKREIFPVLAHPDRYSYLHNDWSKVKKLFGTDVLFQVNVMSLAGAYGKPHQELAERLIDNGMVHFLGSDCHKVAHQQKYAEVMKSKYYKKALDLELHNHYL